MNLDDANPPLRREQLSTAQRQLLAQRLKGNVGTQTGIVPLHHSEPVALSFQQERIWIQEQITPGTAAQNIAQVTCIEGPVSFILLQRALDMVVVRHSSLRTSFVLIDGVPQQKIEDKLSIPVERFDLRQSAPDTRNAQLQRLLQEAVDLPFADLSRGPLLRARLISMHSREHYFSLTIHHILGDGWSLGLLRNELKHCYQALESAQATSLPPLPIQYADYAHWQRRQLTPQQAAVHRAYWKQALDGAVSHIEFPSDLPRLSQASSRAGIIHHHLPASGLQALQAVANSEGASMFMAAIAAFQFLIQQHTGENDFLIGVPFAGRNHVETEALIGCFINPMALRADLKQATSFRQLLQAVRARVLGMFAHQEYPFAKVVADTQTERDDDMPLFQLMFTWQGNPRARAAAGSDGWSSKPSDSGATQLDLTLLMDEHADGVNATLIYRADTFSRSFCEKIVARYAYLLEWLGQHPDAALANADALPPAERSWLKQQLSVSAPASCRQNIASLFLLQAQRQPHAMAIACQHSALSYNELAARAAAIAGLLSALAIQPGERVALALPRTALIAPVMLGIWAVGACCVLIDPTIPQARLEFILRDSQARCLLLDAASETAIAACAQLGIPLFERQQLEVANASVATGFQATDAGALAYIIYTSGSTGVPKGVMVEHGALSTQLRWRIDKCQLQTADCVLHTIPFHFDPSLWQLFGPLLSGGRVFIASETDCKDPQVLAQLMTQQRVSIVDFVPSMLRAFLSAASARSLAGLRIIFCGGETLERDLLELVQQHSQAIIFNQYGPTEATIDSTSWNSVRDALHINVPIGRPIYGKHIYICDSNLRLLPPGVFGEICIGGPALARGYLNDPVKTATSFVPDPFADEPGVRMYRSGDLGRVLPDGQIEYAGRIDTQVKIRGHRIELAEITVQLLKHSAVREAKVIVNPQNGLHAHLVLHADASVSQETLQELLAAHLPRYMLPDAIFFHAALPLTANGKLDEKRLAALPARPASRAVHGASGPLQQLVHACWQRILKIDNIAEDDNFFSLGGNSLGAIYLMAELKAQTGYALPVNAVFSHPTIQRLSAFIASRQNEVSDLPPLQKLVQLPAQQALSWRQRWIWRWVQTNKFQDLQQSLVALRLDGDVNLPALRQALDFIQQRHEALRTRFDGDLEHGWQSVQAASGQVLEISQGKSAGDEQEWLQQQWRTRLDYRQGQSFRAALLLISDTQAILCLMLHKLIDDGAANTIVVSELLQTYEAVCQATPNKLPAAPLQQSDYVAWEIAALSATRIAQLQARYLQFLGTARPLQLVPQQQPNNSAQTLSSRFELEQDLQQALHELARRYRVTPYVTLMAAWQLCLFRLSGQASFLLGTPMQCRDEPELHKTVVRTVNMALIPSKIQVGDSFASLLEKVSESIAKVQELRHMPYLVLHEALVQQWQTPEPLTAVFNYVAAKERIWQSAGLSIKPAPLKISRQAEHDLYLLAAQSEHKIQCILFARDDAFSVSMVEHISQLFVATLKMFVDSPEELITDEKIPLDVKQIVR